MIQLFLRARAEKLARAYFGEGGFKTRSSERDAAIDRSRVGSIMSAIEEARGAAEAEQAGLKRRFDDVLARASIVVGNEVDEYLDREPHRTSALNFFDTEIVRAEQRLKGLATLIVHLRFLKTATITRFPELNAPLTSHIQETGG
jgi:hypothetical protein